MKTSAEFEEETAKTRSKMKVLKRRQNLRRTQPPPRASKCVLRVGTKSVQLKGHKVTENRENNFLNTLSSLSAVARAQSGDISAFPKNIWKF